MNSRESIVFSLALAACLAFGAGPARAGDGDAPAASPASGTEAKDDAGDALMRFMFKVNEGIDTLVVRPVATFYQTFTPPPAQKGVHNMVNNLRSPLVFANDLLQGRRDRAGITLERALINTTSGFLGWNDKAAEQGVKGHDEDFGQTLGVWGMGDGPYMVLPVIGPSNPRDAVGAVVDFLTTPPGVGAAYAVDRRAAMDQELADIKKNSIDHYAAIRSMYLQNRHYEIANEDDQKAVQAAAGEDFPQVSGDDF